MKCVQCPFHMVCHMGRLGAGPDGHRGTTQLCPRCGKFIYVPGGTPGDRNPSRMDFDRWTIFAFDCELRTLSRDIKRAWAELRGQNEYSFGAVTLATLMVEDPGPGLPPVRHGDSDPRTLRVAECLLCSRFMGRVPHLRWVDLDEMAKVDEEGRGRRGAFGLREPQGKRGE